MPAAAKNEPKSVVRQVRFQPAVFKLIEAKCAELRMPVARYIALATARSLGPIEGLDALHGDLAKLRDIEAHLRGET